VTVERDANGVVNVVLAENIAQKDNDGTPIYEYDQTRIVTDGGKYRARTLASWKPLATPEKYEGCVMTANGLMPSVDSVKPAALDPAVDRLQEAEAKTSAPAEIPADG
jgi:hypothetical protein